MGTQVPLFLKAPRWFRSWEHTGCRILVSKVPCQLWLSRPQCVLGSGATVTWSPCQKIPIPWCLGGKFWPVGFTRSRDSVFLTPWAASFSFRKLHQSQKNWNLQTSALKAEVVGDFNLWPYYDLNGGLKKFCLLFPCEKWMFRDTSLGEHTTRRCWEAPAVFTLKSSVWIVSSHLTTGRNSSLRGSGWELGRGHTRRNQGLCILNGL